MEKIDVPLIIDEESIEAPQMHMPEMNHDTRKLSFAEVELGFSREDAIKEACRCLRCDAAV
jgi:NADH-quinone oxidoreductase subunit F